MTIEEYVNNRINSLISTNTFLETDDVHQIAEEVRNSYGLPCKAFYAGEFDSVGYDCWYYTLVWYDGEELHGMDIQCESY